MADRHYTRDEIQAILARAIERQAHGAGDADLSHAQLLETAREVGLSQAEIEAAVADMDRSRARGLVVAELQERRKTRLKHHIAVFVAVNLGLWGIDAATAGMGVNAQAGWHWIVLAAWGIGLAIQGWWTFNADPASLSRAAERYQRRRARKLQQQQMQQAIEGAVTDVVTTGADALTRLLDPERQKRRDRDRRP